MGNTQTFFKYRILEIICSGINLFLSHSFYKLLALNGRIIDRKISKKYHVIMDLQIIVMKTILQDHPNNYCFKTVTKSNRQEKEI